MLLVDYSSPKKSSVAAADTQEDSKEYFLCIRVLATEMALFE